MLLTILNFKWTKNAFILSTSQSTLYRRLYEAGISSNDCTLMSKESLDELIQSIKQNHPNDGEVVMLQQKKEYFIECSML